MPLHKREPVREGILDSIYADRDMLSGLPSQHCPGDEMRPAEAFQAISDELLLDGNARQNLATFCQTWEEPSPPADGPLDQQEPDRQGRVPPDRRDRAALRPDAGRPVERPRRRADAVGCSAIGSSEACMLGGMAAKWRWRAKRRAEGKSDRQPQHGVRAGPGGLAQVRQVLGHRDARDPHVPGALLHGRRADARPGRREHHHGGPHLRSDLHRRLRAGPASWSQALDQLQADTGPRRRHPRRRGIGCLPGSVLCARGGVGLP